MTSRITDPFRVSAAEVQSILAVGWNPTIQFSTSATPSLLQEVNALCRQFGDALEVRFYGFYGDAFDANALEHLPDVEHLSVDCLTAIRNEHRLGELPRLKKLRFGVHKLDRPDVLSLLPLEQLTTLSIAKSAKRNIDLAPITRCVTLSELVVVGHTRNLEAVAQLGQLERLGLHAIAKSQSLDFVSSIRGLRELRLLLGGRADIEDLHHETLEALNIDRVLGVEHLGSLARFPALRRLRITDQAHLKAIDLSGPALEDVAVINCKALETLAGVMDLPTLHALRVYRCPGLDIDTLTTARWPPALDVLALYTGRTKRDAALRALLDQRGYREG